MRLVLSLFLAVVLTGMTALAGKWDSPDSTAIVFYLKHAKKHSAARNYWLVRAYTNKILNLDSTNNEAWEIRGEASKHPGFLFSPEYADTITIWRALTDTSTRIRSELPFKRSGRDKATIPTNPDGSEPDVFPEMVKHTAPEYPRVAKTAGISGVVTVMALVDKEGTVIDSRILNSSKSSLLDNAALKAAFKCKFKPGVSKGEAIACWVSYDVTFSLGK